MSKPAKAAAKASRFFRMVSQESPAWLISSTSRSNSTVSSRDGKAVLARRDRGRGTDGPARPRNRRRSCQRPAEADQVGAHRRRRRPSQSTAAITVVTSDLEHRAADWPGAPAVVAGLGLRLAAAPHRAGRRRAPPTRCRTIDDDARSASSSRATRPAPARSACRRNPWDAGTAPACRGRRSWARRRRARARRSALSRSRAAQMSSTS